MNLAPTPMALLRYQAISAYLALAPGRGKRKATLAMLAGKTWTLPDGRPVQFTEETLRTWVRRYRKRGLDGLEDAPRHKRGTIAISPELVELFCKLKQEVPERSLDRLILIAEELSLVAPSTVARSTLHRALKARGLSTRPRPETSVKDLDRFEALAPNDLWQSDMLVGPWLPDPERPGKVRRAYLYAFIDDHSRLLLAGRWSFRGDLPALELVMREALRRHGVPSRVYYDNGATYRSRHMEQIVANLGIHAMVFTEVRRPEGHGKIEAFNHLCRNAFIAELKASPITTLDALNLAFAAWVERYYNGKLHTDIHAVPRDRWRAGLDRVKHVDEEILRRAFLWTETRTTDRTGLFSLFGRRYQAGAGLGKKKLLVRYDPEHLEELELWHEGRFVERVRPFDVQQHRRPKPATPTPAAPAPASTTATADWLGHLVAERQASFAEDPDAALRSEVARLAALDEAFVELLRSHLAPEVFDESAIREWLDRYGPIDAKRAEWLLDHALPVMGTSLHIQEYLRMIHAALLPGDDA